jgi:hypothetical protein
VGDDGIGDGTGMDELEELRWWRCDEDKVKISGWGGGPFNHIVKVEFSWCLGGFMGRIGACRRVGKKKFTQS